MRPFVGILALIALALGIALLGCTQPSTNSNPVGDGAPATVVATAPAKATFTPTVSVAPTVNPTAEVVAVKSIDDAANRLLSSASVRDEFASQCDGTLRDSLAIMMQVTFSNGQPRLTCKAGPAYGKYVDPETGWKSIDPAIPALLVRCSEDDALFLARALTMPPRENSQVALSTPLNADGSDFYVLVGTCRMDPKVNKWTRVTYAIESANGQVHT